MELLKGHVLEVKGTEIGHQVVEILEVYDRAGLVPDEVDVQAWTDNADIDYTLELVGNPWYKIRMYKEFEDNYLPHSDLEPTIVRIYNK
jgi:hypothetical protein